MSSAFNDFDNLIQLFAEQLNWLHFMMNFEAL